MITSDLFQKKRLSDLSVTACGESGFWLIFRLYASMRHTQQNVTTEQVSKKTVLVHTEHEIPVKNGACDVE